MACLGLEAPQRKHEAARRVAPVRAERHRPGDIKGTDDLAARANLHLLPQVDADERVVDQLQSLLQRRAHMIREFKRSCASTAFLAVDDNEVRSQSRLQHRFADRKPFPRMTDAELETRRLSA